MSPPPRVGPLTSAPPPPHPGGIAATANNTCVAAQLAHRDRRGPSSRLPSGARNSRGRTRPASTPRQDGQLGSPAVRPRLGSHTLVQRYSRLIVEVVFARPVSFVAFEGSTNCVPPAKVPASASRAPQNPGFKADEVARVAAVRSAERTALLPNSTDRHVMDLGG